MFNCSFFDYENITTVSIINEMFISRNETRNCRKDAKVKKMFDRILKKKSIPVTIDIFLDYLIYDKFRAYVTKNHLDESSALTQVLERGMANYWLQEFKHLKQNYLPMKKLFEEYKKDYEAFEAIEKQNEQLQKILEEKCQQKKIVHESTNSR